MVCPNFSNGCTGEKNYNPISLLLDYYYYYIHFHFSSSKKTETMEIQGI